jgi:type IV pilus assembly protein PilV
MKLKKMPAVQTCLALNSKQGAPFGFALTEVLVAVLVLSIGILGIAGLQMESLQSNNDAMHRSEALWLAQELVERMRANPNGVGSGAYTDASNDDTLCNNTTPPTVCADYYNYSTGTKISAVNCTADQVAAFDVWELKCGYQYSNTSVFANAADFLRNGRLSVQCVANVPDDGNPCTPVSFPQPVWRFAVTADWLGKGETNVSEDSDDDEVSFQVIP